MEALIPTKCNGRVVKSKGGGSIRPFFCEIFLIIKNGPVNTGPLHYKTLSALLRFQRELPDIAEAEKYVALVPRLFKKAEVDIEVAVAVCVYGWNPLVPSFCGKGRI